MIEVLSLIGVIPIIGIIAACCLYRRQRSGNSQVTTASVAYNRDHYSAILDWDKHGFIIHGTKIQLFSGEFHYWRLPDKSRWETILMKYRATGLNCIRIYFHWGFHSPNEGVYHYDGNRDIKFLLDLCVKLKLYVLCAPGPYICAETSAGGYPFWLLAKKHINIRHSKSTFVREWDAEFAFYSLEWWSEIIAQLKPFQITESLKGCIIGLQIENEYIENVGPIPVGLADEMKFLCYYARKLGMSVPFFTNDGIEIGSYVPRKNSTKFGVDLYGFDKYVIFVPISHPMVNVFGGEKYRHIKNWLPWKPVDFSASIDSVEKTVRGFGGDAMTGGWFNHYHLEHSYDDIYNYYGESYTKNIFESVVAQGSNAFNFYMFYGGTNWGTIGDPDVYTSYDYSACIREYGFLSGRGRKLRLAISFARSFKEIFRDTITINPCAKVYPRNILNKQRQTISNNLKILPIFTFIRNFSESNEYTLTMQNCILKGTIPFKSSFVSLGNYVCLNGIQLIASTIPIHFKTTIDKNEVWIVQSDDEISGQFAFKDQIKIGGPMLIHTEILNEMTLVKLQKSSGWTSIGSKENELLYIIVLTGNDLFTLNPIWEDSWKQEESVCFWGSTDVFYNHSTKRLEISTTKLDKSLFILAQKCPKSFTTPPVTHSLHGCPFIFTYSLENLNLPLLQDIVPPALSNWKERTVDFDNQSFTWKYIPIESNSINSITPSMDTLDLGLNSGHLFYRIKFEITGSTLHLDINARHRVTLFLNNEAIGGHLTYSLHLFRAGSKVGPDKRLSGTQRYLLPPHLLKKSNVLVIQVENFGYNRQAFLFNDVRNKRGIINAKLIPGKQTTIKEIQMQVSGVDTRVLDNVFSTSGFPDETMKDSRSCSRSDIKIQSQLIHHHHTQHTLKVPISSTPVWYYCSFDRKETTIEMPLRILMDGKCTVYLWINDTLFGRYYGNKDGPQKSFYVIDGLIEKKNNELKFLCYDGRIEVKGNGELSVSLIAWKLSSDIKKYWSGNKDEKGDDLVLVNSVIDL